MRRCSPREDESWAKLAVAIKLRTVCGRDVDDEAVVWVIRMMMCLFLRAD